MMTNLKTSSVGVLEDRQDKPIHTFKYYETYRRQYLANAEWLNSEEVAEYFNIKMNTLDHWCSMGKITFFQPTNKRWFHRDDINAFISKKRKEAIYV